MVSSFAAGDADSPRVLAVRPQGLDRIEARLPAPLTSLVGRERETAAVRALLLREEVRLLTLTGPGGVGKTRLAIAVAEGLAEAFPGGIAFVPLAAIGAPELVGPEVFQILSGGEIRGDFSLARLHHLIGEREILLVLDNFEHLQAATPVASGMIEGCPKIKLLVTSRVALRLSGEQEFLVPPLTLPGGRTGALAGDDEPQRSEAVRLFVLRAAAARSDFVPELSTLPVIGAICQRLDGLPLAIELAAARVAHLSPGAMVARMDRAGAGPLPLLTGGARDLPARQQTMRDTIAWSFDLLSEEEQTLFCQLSVFVGGFTLPAAAAVCGMDEWSLLEGIGSLVAKSLIRFDGDVDGEPRYEMLQTIREFGRDCLAARGEELAVRSRFAGWCLEFAERAGPEVMGPASDIWLAALEREHPNLRAAMSWFLQQDEGEHLIHLASALWPFWQEHAHYAEGRHWLETALDLGRNAPVEIRIRASDGAGTMAWQLTDFEHATRHHQRALTLAREVRDRDAEAFALNNLGVQASALGDFDAAAQHFKACVAIAREAALPLQEIRSLHNLAQIQRFRYDSASAAKSMERVLAVCHHHGLTWPLPFILLGLGLVATDLGDYERAASALREGVTLIAAKGNVGVVIDGIEGLARLAAVSGQEEAAIRLYGAGEGLREKLEYPLTPADCTYTAPVLERLRATIEPDGFAAAWNAGRSLTREQALAEALALEFASVTQQKPEIGRRATPHGLSRREVEVLRLLVAGRTNREIGEALFISTSTAARHVANVYNKLGVDSRTAAVTYAVKHDLV